MIEFDMFLWINVLITVISTIVMIISKSEEVLEIVAGIASLAWLSYAVVMGKYIPVAMVLATMYVLICLYLGLPTKSSKSKKK